MQDKKPAKKQTPKTTVKKPRGRPKAEFDLEKVELFGYFRATYETMAEILGCHYDTIRRNMQNPESNFSKAYKKGYGNLKQKLSESQITCAINGNATMLVWLGKQHLGQSDTPDQSQDVDDKAIAFEGWE